MKKNCRYSKKEITFSVNSLSNLSLIRYRWKLHTIYKILSILQCFGKVNGFREIWHHIFKTAASIYSNFVQNKINIFAESQRCSSTVKV